LFFIPILGDNQVFAQANKTNSGDVICPASGTSIQVAPIRSSRFSYIINNISGGSIRVGYLDTGTALLDGTNSWVLQAGQATADSAPGVLSNRIVCMSTSASTATITFNETFR
jgi:hypothetical protein